MRLAHICLVLSSLGLALNLHGCLATRGWVREQNVLVEEKVSQVDGKVTQLAGDVSDLDSRLRQTNDRVDGVVGRLDHLRLERRFVLNLKDGVNFVPNSNALTKEAKRQIDGFLGDLERTEDNVFFVAGHTDSVGGESHNYELGQRRASAVARYLTSKGIDPLRVSAVSYGESMPLTSNSTSDGRRRNRRIEIMVYKEGIATTPPTTTEGATPRTQMRGPKGPGSVSANRRTTAP
jgi:outer membrane protein OmpA-like peptidoglycan-associated protein